MAPAGRCRDLRQPVRGSVTIGVPPRPSRRGQLPPTTLPELCRQVNVARLVLMGGSTLTTGAAATWVTVNGTCRPAGHGPGVARPARWLPSRWVRWLNTTFTPSPEPAWTGGVLLRPRGPCRLLPEQYRLDHSGLDGQSDVVLTQREHGHRQRPGWPASPAADGTGTYSATVDSRRRKSPGHRSRARLRHHGNRDPAEPPQIGGRSHHPDHHGGQ